MKAKVLKFVGRHVAQMDIEKLGKRRVKIPHNVEHPEEGQEFEIQEGWVMREAEIKTADAPKPELKKQDADKE